MLTSKTIEQIRKRLDKMTLWRYAPSFVVPLEAAETMEHFRQPPDELPYKKAPINSSWGVHWGTVWFRGEIEIPRELRGKRIFYRHRHDGERLLFVNGQPIAGMDPYHQEVLLTPKAKGGEQYSIYVEAYCGHPMRYVDAFDPKLITMHGISGASQEPPPLPLRESVVVVEREVVTGFLYDAEVLYRTALLLDAKVRIELDGEDHAPLRRFPAFSRPSQPFESIDDGVLSVIPQPHPRRLKNPVQIEGRLQPVGRDEASDDEALVRPIQSAQIDDGNR